MASEVSHLGTVKLYSFGGDSAPFLVHLLTGECIKLDRQYELDFDTNFAFLDFAADPTFEPVWVNSLFDFSVFADGEEGGPQEFYVWSKSQKTKTPLCEFQQSMVLQALVYSHGGKDMTAELYIHKVPREVVHMKRFWTAPRVQAMVFRESNDSKWACKGYDKLCGIMRCLEFRVWDLGFRV